MGNMEPRRAQAPDLSFSPEGLKREPHKAHVGFESADPQISTRWEGRCWNRWLFIPASLSQGLR